MCDSAAKGADNLAAYGPMKILALIAMLIATPAAGEGAQVTVNADTLIKAAYCLGVQQAWLAEAKESLGSVATPPEFTKLRAYVAAFLLDRSLPDNIRSLLSTAIDSGRQDVDRCGKFAASMCATVRAKEIRECVDRAHDISVCKKIRGCEDFDTPF